MTSKLSLGGCPANSDHSYSTRTFVTPEHYDRPMEIFSIIGLLTAYFKYLNAKKSEALKNDDQPVDNTLAEELPEIESTRINRLAQWLGLVD